MEHIFAKAHSKEGDKILSLQSRSLTCDTLHIQIHQRSVQDTQQDLPTSVDCIETLIQNCIFITCTWINDKKVDRGKAQKKNP
jgi:hypothetical protein